MATVRLNLYERPHNRSLYANGPNNETLGRIDLNGRRVYFDVDNPRVVRDVATRFVLWASEHPEAFAAEAITATPESNELWEDLAERAAGEGLQARIVEERAKVRARSRSWALADRLILRDEGWAGPWIRGLKGERLMAKTLRKKRVVRQGWRILHSVPLPGGGDIDHLLIGPNGVVAINTKYHRKARMSVTPRAIYVRGARTEYLDDAREMARRASEVLSPRVGFAVDVIPCVALSNGRSIWNPSLEVMGRPTDVLVGTNWNLPLVLWDAEQGLSREAVDAIYDVARKSTTWQ